ncbi:MAG: type II toxin-antitoxin system HicB family antitoxin [Ignavibacteriae bacterium]|nr:type II toxin-antitoxin system HicB family antitoxin [Ignavibacteriota bacterium]
MKKNIFEILVHEAEEGGYWAECPSLDGCYSQGDTLDELQTNIKEAIELSLEEIRARNKRIPTSNRMFVMPVSV